MRKYLILALAAAALVAGCTDAQFAKFGALGDPARVTCFSGGVRVLDDFSTGKVSNSESSDGFYYKSRTTGRLQEASGDCQLDYGAERSVGFQPILP